MKDKNDFLLWLSGFVTGSVFMYGVMHFCWTMDMMRRGIPLE